MKKLRYKPLNSVNYKWNKFAFKTVRIKKTLYIAKSFASLE